MSSNNATNNEFHEGDAIAGTFVVWLYAAVSVFTISIFGLIPIISMPRLQRSKYQNDLLQFLIGLAIGTLTADALLHLLPLASHSHVLSTLPSTNTSQKHMKGNSDFNPTFINQISVAHSKTEHSDNHEQHDHMSSEGFWFGFMALTGIIGFLLLERIMVLLTDVFNHHEHSIAANSESKPDSESNRSGVVQMAESYLHEHQNHHQHQHHHLTSKTKSFMFMIITGDGLHNFFDGIAIGVSYGHSLAIGLSTSIAILCHELPHEIGDFAVLIKSGMTIKKAVLFNTMSSALCLIGASVGVFIGKLDVGWVSALIAGMFLYISLVDMVPQLDCYQAKPALTRAKKLLIQFTGIFGGVGIMSLIAIFESKLKSLITA